MGQESIRAHRAFRRLGLGLARAGLHTLRFDYYGCGDSAGESDECDVDDWMRDIAKAVEELKTHQSLSRIALIGLRLGATLAALVASQRTDIESLVLWEPILNGRDYLREGMIAHQAWLNAQGFGSSRVDSSDGTREMLGFPLTQAMRASIERLDLLNLRERPAANILIIEREESADIARLREHLAGLRVGVDCRHIPEPPVWLRREMDQAVVPRRTLECIVAWLAGAHR